jgi:hypothetical protein
LRGFSIHVQCPRCWSENLKVFSKRDYVEGFQNGFLRRIQGWMGAPLNYCERCRLQFYDARPRRRKDPTGGEQSQGSEPSCAVE